MAVSSAGLGPESHCSVNAQKQLHSKLQTRPLAREGVPHQETRNYRTENKSLFMVSNWETDSNTDCRLNVGRKPQGLVLPEGLVKMKNSFTSSSLDPATFRFVA
jgi:hypothetical protein